MIKLIKHAAVPALLASFLLNGCGENARNQSDTLSNLQPHRIDRILEDNNLPENYTDFAEKIQIHTLQVDNKMFLRIEADDVELSDIAHVQIYLDTDNNASTGLSMGNGLYAIVGADYMIEDSQLFQSTSHTTWTWKHIGEVINAYNMTGTDDASDDYTTGDQNIRNYFKDVEIDTTLLKGMPKQDGMKIRVSIEPIDSEWSDSNNYVPSKNVESKLLEHYELVSNFDEDIQGDGSHVRISDDGQYGFFHYVKSFSPSNRKSFVHVFNMSSAEIYDIDLGRTSALHSDLFNIKYIGDGKISYRKRNDTEDRVLSLKKPIAL